MGALSPERPAPQRLPSAFMTSPLRTSGHPIHHLDGPSAAKIANAISICFTLERAVIFQCGPELCIGLCLLYTVHNLGGHLHRAVPAILCGVIADGVVRISPGPKAVVRVHTPSAGCRNVTAACFSRRIGFGQIAIVPAVKASSRLDRGITAECPKLLF